LNAPGRGAALAYTSSKSQRMHRADSLGGELARDHVPGLWRVHRLTCLAWAVGTLRFARRRRRHYFGQFVSQLVEPVKSRASAPSLQKKVVNLRSLLRAVRGVIIDWRGVVERSLGVRISSDEWRARWMRPTQPISVFDASGSPPVTIAWSIAVETSLNPIFVMPTQPRHPDDTTYVVITAFVSRTIVF
jgi:hypothetical protein